MILISLIKTCSECGVTSFKKGDLEIQFQLGKSVVPDYPVQKDAPEQVLVDEKLTKQNEYQDAEDEMQELLIMNPVEYEERLFKDELQKSEIDDA